MWRWGGGWWGGGYPPLFLLLISPLVEGSHLSCAVQTQFIGKRGDQISDQRNHHVKSKLCILNLTRNCTILYINDNLNGLLFCDFDDFSHVWFSIFFHPNFLTHQSETTLLWRKMKIEIWLWLNILADYFMLVVILWSGRGWERFIRGLNFELVRIEGIVVHFFYCFYCGWVTIYNLKMKKQRKEKNLIHW